MTVRTCCLLALLGGLGLAACADPTLDEAPPPPAEGAFRMEATCARTECDLAEEECLAATDPTDVCGGNDCSGCGGGGQGSDDCEPCLSACLAEHCASLCEAPEASPCLEHTFAMELPEPRPELLSACTAYVTSLGLEDPEEETAALLACDRRARAELESMAEVYRCLAETPGATLEEPGPCPLPVADPAIAASICDRDASECGSCDPERAERLAATDHRFEPDFLAWLLFCYGEELDCADRDRCLEAWLAVTE